MRTFNGRDAISRKYGFVGVDRKTRVMRYCSQVNRVHNGQRPLGVHYWRIDYVNSHKFYFPKDFHVTILRYYVKCVALQGLHWLKNAGETMIPITF